jgi:hypothetical protein
MYYTITLILKWDSPSVTQLSPSKIVLPENGITESNLAICIKKAQFSGFKR